LLRCVSKVKLDVFCCQLKVDIMEQKHKDLLISNRVYLVENLDMSVLYDHMLQSKLISESDRQTMKVTM